MTGALNRGASWVFVCGLGALVLVTAPIAWTEEQSPNRGPVLLAARQYDERTVIAPSRIPLAGFGLYARVGIAEGEIIGELGGQLVRVPDPEHPSAYLAGLPECAFEKTPYRYLDSQDYGGNVSRANFAPRTINARETHFQNARLERHCEAPFVVFVATRDIKAGEEIWTSYGPDYDYQRFMYDPAVQSFFCGLIEEDCRTRYEFEH